MSEEGEGAPFRYSVGSELCVKWGRRAGIRCVKGDSGGRGV